MKHCMYCKKEIAVDAAVDVCQQCGEQVWGPKMFKAIQDNMTQAREVGDLYQGSVTEIKNESGKLK